MQRPACTRCILSTLFLIALAVVASLPAQAQTFSVIHNFTGGMDGANPQAGLSMDRAGNLYGTTGDGGAHSFGTVYRLKHLGSGWIFMPLYGFQGGNDAAGSLARVIIGPTGTLYGTSPGGGCCGSVFNVRPAPRPCLTALCPWEETVIYRFTGSPDGLFPQEGDLVFDQAGNIYGTTIQGGSNNSGAVYKLTPSGGNWTEEVSYSFPGGNGGDAPRSGVIFDNAGNLYGTTVGGGSQNAGVVFQLVRSGSGWIENILHTFQGADGANPFGGLIFDAAGNLYGSTTGGGSGGGGTVFKLTPSGGGYNYSLIYSFTGTFINCGPGASLAFDVAGNLYGTTMCDGATSEGNVFQLTPSNGSWTYTSLHDFTGGNDGGDPQSNVVFDAAGNLYGTAVFGGSGCAPDGCGTVWEITP
jgi:uncharacterized repeat protein (TIGR03803 family)